jgi:hypothetical protein
MRAVTDRVFLRDGDRCVLVTIGDRVLDAEGGMPAYVGGRRHPIGDCAGIAARSSGLRASRRHYH